MFVDNMWGFIALFTACALTLALCFHLAVNVLFPKITTLLKSLTKKQGYNFRNGLIDQAIALNSNRGEVQTALVAEFQKLTNNSSYKLSEKFGAFSADMFMTLLQQAGYLLTTFTEWCDDESCRTILKTIAPDGTTLFMSFGFQPNFYEDHKGRPHWKFTDEDANLALLVDEKKNFSYGSQLNIVHAAHLSEADDSIAGLLRCHEESRIESISYKESVFTNSNIGRVKYSSYGPQVYWEKQKINHFTDEQVDSQYAPIKLSYSGEEVACHASDAFNFGVTAMMNKANLFLYGPPGLGKTTMARQLLGRLQRFPDTYCIWLGVDTVSTMISRNGGVQEMVELLQSLGQGMDREPSIYLFIDEAEKLMEETGTGVHSEMATLILELLDGAIRTSIGNVTTCLVFNADPNKLNPRLFRKGRGMLLELGLLDTDRATKFMLSLRDTMDKDMVFDPKQFDKLLTQEQVQTDGQVYAPIGFTTVADVVDCYRAKAVNDTLITAIRAASKPKVYTKPMSAPKPPTPKVASAPLPVVTKPTPQLHVVKGPSPNVVVMTTPGPDLPVAPVAAIPKPKNRHNHNNKGGRRR
jgi:GTPase SAR1 family protein